MRSRGGLPAAWLGTRGSLPALQSLALEGNLLGGTLPEAAPGALPSLQSLGLQWNQLEARRWLSVQQPADLARAQWHLRC